MQIRILRHECTGSGSCVEIAPGAFGLDPRGRAIVIDPESEAAAKVFEAAEACPRSAIEVLDDEGEVLFP